MSYTIVTSSRARYVRVTVRHGGGVTVTVPQNADRTMVDRFLAKRAGWIERAVKRMKTREPLIALPRSQYPARREEALRFVRERIAALNAHYTFSIRSVSIRNFRSMWGSCSRKGDLRFHYKIIFLPKHLADYLIVHELCHLKHPNHSESFWDLVAETIRSPKTVAKELRRYRTS